MSFLAPAGLFALLGIPAVLALHLFRRKLPERRVAGLFLWPRETVAADAGRRRTQLLRSGSLWCELLLALVASLLLGRLAFGAGSRAQHFVVVLDDSASMSARRSDRSVADAARDLVRERLAALPGSAIVTLITTGARPEIVAGPRVPADLVAPALTAWKPRRGAHDALPALQLGAQLLGHEGDRLLFVTDVLPVDRKPIPKCCEIQALGARLANHAIVSASRQVHEDGKEESLYVGVMTFTEGKVSVEVVVTAEDSEATEIKREVVELAPDAVKHVAVRMPASRFGVRVRLAADALALDDEVLLLPEPSTIVKVANLLPVERSRELRVERLLEAVPQVARAESLEAAHLLLAPAPGAPRPFVTEVVVAPARAPAPGTESAPSAATRASQPSHEDWIGPYLLERRHPILRGVTLDGVIWCSGNADVPGQPIVSAVDRILVAEEHADESTRVHLNLAPERSNLAASPDWPILFGNLVARARARMPGQVAANVRVGDRMVWRSPLPIAESRTARFVGPDGRAWPARGTTTLAQDGREPGLWRLLAADRELARWSVLFADPDESDLRHRGSGTIAAEVQDARAPAGPGSSEGRVEARVLAILLVLLLTLDWWFLARRSSHS